MSGLTREQMLWGGALILAVVLILLGAGAAVKNAGSGRQPEPLFRQILPDTAAEARKHADLFQRVPTERPDTKRQERQRAIEAYQARIDARKDTPEEMADMLFALGTLYRQERDFENAALAFEQITRDYPESSKYQPAWLELLTCYEILDNSDKIRQTCLDMLKVFPQESDMYRLAESKLRLNEVDVPGPLPEPSAPETEAAE